MGAIEISNYDRVFGMTTHSETFSSDIPSCSSSFEGSPALFYKYTSLYDYEEIIIDTCLSNSDFDSYLSIYSGDCGDLQCIGFDDNAYGSFTLRVQEKKNFKILVIQMDHIFNVHQ